MHADKWGPLGSVFAALCCLGAAPVIGALSGAALVTVGGLWLSGLVVGLGLAMLVSASAWNWVLVRRIRKTLAPAGRSGRTG